MPQSVARARRQDPDGEPFETFIRKALVDQLTIAGLFAERAATTLTGRLDAIDFSSGWTDAAWDITITVQSSNGQALSVREHYPLDGSFAVDT